LLFESLPTSRQSLWAVFGQIRTAHVTCVETVISELSIEMLMPSLNTATQIVYVVGILWRSVGIYQHIWPYFRRPFKILTSPLNSVTPDFLKESYVYVDDYTTISDVFLTVQIRKLSYFYFSLFDLMTLCHMLKC